MIQIAVSATFDDGGLFCAGLPYSGVVVRVVQVRDTVVPEVPVIHPKRGLVVVDAVVLVSVKVVVVTQPQASRQPSAPMVRVYAVLHDVGHTIPASWKQHASRPV